MAQWKTQSNCRRRGFARAGRGRRWSLLPAAMLVSLALSAEANDNARVGWVQGEHYAQRTGNPSLYWPGNILDGSSQTVWCVEGGPHAANGQSVRIGFGGASVNVERVVITTGDGRSEDAFSRSNRVTRVLLHDGRYRRTVSVSDKPGPQTVQLSHPIRGLTVDLVIEGVTGDADLTCLTGIVFQQENRALNGAWMARHTRYDSDSAPLLGVWALGPAGAPDRFLTFFMDGTYRYSYRPLIPSREGSTSTGRYRVADGRLQMQTDGAWRTVTAERVTHRDEIGEVELKLRLSDASEELAELEGDWVSWRL